MAVKLMAFDLDGTLTQHKTPLEEKNRRVLQKLSEKYRLVMVGAGSCMRIFKQMNEFPIDVIGNYGMQFAEYNYNKKELEVVSNDTVPVDTEEILRRAALIRDKYNLHDFAGKTMEIHDSGMLTFPVLGTEAKIEDKLAYDPDKAKRKVMYPYVKELFHDYNVVIGGTSSFDIIPGKYGKYNSLMRYAEKHNFSKDEIVYCGDDYMTGGNDHDVYLSGIKFIIVDLYTNFEKIIEQSGLL
ncbi:MAG: HAD-IIB family hydrolase [Clostridiales bacterium]|nr:HAD-IIB family hydrolase [Clostridiales bacterium]